MIYIVLSIALIISTVIGMECIAWTVHKYIMHGPLWFIHKTHHQARKGFFELNDIFGIFFAVIAILCFVQGIITDNSLMISIGVGITLYGFLYFFAHDIIVHQRVKLFTKSSNSYILALKKAHRIHHKTLTKKNAEEFGFLFVKKEYIQRSK